MKKRRVIWIVLSIVIVGGLVFLGGGWLLRQRRARAADLASNGTEIVTAFVGDLDASANASGRLQPRQQATLALSIAGRVERLDVRIGDRVHVGDALLQLEADALARAVQTAEQNLAIQEANLAELRKAPDPAEVASAEAAVANARAQLADLLAGPRKEDLARAEASVASAQARLEEVLAGTSEEQLAQARAALTSARAGLQAAEARTAALDGQLLAAQNSIDTAQLAVDQARDMYNLLIWRDPKVADSWGPYSPQAAALEKARINYDVAVANYRLTKLNVNDSGLLAAKAQVAQSEASLAALGEANTAQVASARAQVARAEAGLAALREEKTVQIASARAQLAQAEASLASLLRGASAEQIAMAAAQVEQARISLEDAQSNLAQATLWAPFDGLVTDVYVAEGEIATGVAVELVNMDSLQVVLDVDEVDIGEIGVGRAATVVLEAWPDRQFAAQVASIAPRAKEIAGIVTYEVKLDVDWTSASEEERMALFSGMSADADLVTSERGSVLLVPNRAITADREAGAYYVYRAKGDVVEKVQVTIGLRDQRHTEITSGLQEGDELVVGYVERGDLMSQLEEMRPHE